MREHLGEGVHEVEAVVRELGELALDKHFREVPLRLCLDRKGFDEGNSLLVDRLFAQHLLLVEKLRQLVGDVVGLQSVTNEALHLPMFLQKHLEHHLLALLLRADLPVEGHPEAAMAEEMLGHADQECRVFA